MRVRFRPPRAALLLCAALLLALPGLADVFVLEDGRRIQGKLLRKTADHYVVQTGLGELELAVTDVVEIIEQKTDREVFDERWAETTTAGGFFELGQWASQKRMRSNATRAFEKAIELDPEHAEAHKALGHVLYKGEWMTPEERDLRAAAEEEADMLARGLVRHGDRWVTPEEQEKLERGLVFHEGKWFTEDELMRFKGFERFQGRWIPREEAIAREGVAAVEGLLDRTLGTAVTRDALLAGDYGASFLEEIGAGLDAGRAWFDTAFQSEPGLALFGGRMAELYVWNRDNAPYVATVPHFASLTSTVPPGWAEATAKTHGLYWIDPYPLSSSRVWHRPDEDVVGHNYHHWGHLLLGRLGYDGRLLPPWYDEAVASLVEYRIHERNAVFCRARAGSAGSGTSAKSTTARFSFDPNAFRHGGWREALAGALEGGQVQSFDRLAQKHFSDLELMDVAVGMAVLEWLESKQALAGFHAALREHAPPSPGRLIEVTRDRHAAHDAGFSVAGATNWRQADKEWRAWFLSR